MPSNSLIIRSLKSTDSFEEITMMLHPAYRALADMGLRYLASHQDVSVTRQRANMGHSFVALSNDRIVGTISIRDTSQTSGPPGRVR